MSAIEQRHLQALRALVDHQVQFVLIGGVALQAHGYTDARCLDRRPPTTTAAAAAPRPGPPPRPPDGS